jgi:hypothetical protein
MFDQHKLVFLPTMNRDEFQIFSVHLDADALNCRHFKLTSKPYRRGLSARTKMAFKKYLHDEKRVTPDLGPRVVFSDTSSNRLRGGTREDEREQSSTRTTPSSATTPTQTSSLMNTNVQLLGLF